MDAGLSRRMEATFDAGVNYLAPQIHHTPTSTDIIDLSSAQNEVLRPELLEFFKSTTDDSITSQAFELTPAHGGDIQARKALASFFNRYFNPVHAVKSDQIALTAGATDALEAIIHAVCDEGDSVLVPGPYWYGLDEIAKVRPRVNVIAAQPPTYDNYDNYLLASLQAAYDFSSDHSRIKAVLVCNPHVPTARCYPKSTLLGLMEFCQERGLHLICDEVHAMISLNHETSKGPDFVSALSLTEPLSRDGAVKVDPSRVHVVWSASKLFGMSGFRAGALVSQQNPRLLSAVSLLSSRHTSNVSTIYLHSLLKWTQLPTLLSLNSERLTASYHLLASFLESWQIDFVSPTHGICLFARLAKRATSAADEKRILDQLAVEGVQVAHGRKFKGVERSFGWARIRFSVHVDVMRSALEKMDTFLCQTS